MFDWDKDYEQLVTSRPAPGAAGDMRQTAPGLWPGALVLAVGVIVAAGYFGPAFLKPFLSATEMVSEDLPGGETALREVVAIPLQALEPEQALRFRNGLRRFSDADLLFYAGHARRDHAGATAFMQPYMADAEALIGQELARRDL